MPPNNNNQLPEPGSIQEGKVVRIEAYGAFVEFSQFYRLRGLVHISQLAQSKVDTVSDVVAQDDIVPRQRATPAPRP